MQTGILPPPQLVRSFDDGHKLMGTSLSHAFLLSPEECRRLVTTASRQFSVVVQKNHDGAYYALTVGEVIADARLTDGDPRHYDSYLLEVSAAGILVQSGSERGLFYGLNTLGKLRELYGGDLPYCSISDWADTAVRCEYLEFRNFYPPFEQVLEHVREMALSHINELIVEWEDKRPFPTLSFLQDTIRGFSQQQIAALEQAAWEDYLNLIPLQQSFGHLEYVLRHDRYRSLRELEEIPADLSPLNPESAALSTALLNDVMQEFPRAEYIHIGCDEVHTLGKGERSIASGSTAAELFIRFVNQSIAVVCRSSKTPLIWHDMIVNASIEELKALDKRVIVVVWMYDNNDLEYRASAMIEKLQRANVKVWGGCAVRCWDREGLQNTPLLANRKNNILRWRNVAARYSLEGMVNTNWSAYSALAAPYGVYETSRYPACLAASILWNHSEQGERSFLKDYLRLSHGVDPTAVLAEGWEFEDYYRILPRFLPQLPRGHAFAELMKWIGEYENAARDHFPTYLQLFRVLRHHDRQEEWESLCERYAYTLGALRKVREPLLEALKAFLNEEQAEDYVCSRYCLWEMVEREILQLAAAHGHQDAFTPLLTDKALPPR